MNSTLWQADRRHGEDVVGDHLVGLVLEEVFLLLVDVQPQGADAGDLEGLDSGVGVEQAARLVLMIITPSFILKAPLFNR